MLSFRAVLKVGRKNACICQQTFLLCHRFMVYVCKEAKHIDILPERSKHFPEMLTSFAQNVCFFLGKCTVFNPKYPLLWLEKPPSCTEKSAAAFYFILSGRRRSQ